MSDERDIHQGHRKRLTNKILSSSQVLDDHEILEALLFYSIPRINVNPLAHRLLKTFGSISAVFSATKEELLSVDGVGVKTATLIRTVSEITKRSKPKLEKIDFSTPERLYQTIKARFSDLKTESCEVVLLDKKYLEIVSFSFDSFSILSVGTNTNELVKYFTVHKPAFLVLVHNHVFGSCLPSKADLSATGKINLICSLHGVELLDHVILSKNDLYSFRGEGLLDKIKQDADLNKILSANYGGKN